MKANTSITATLLTAALMAASASSSLSEETKVQPQSVSSRKVIPKSLVDYSGFTKLTSEVAAYRKTRLVSLDQFLRLSREKNTIILDTRSAAAYKAVHIKGAIHLNFSDFTEQKLAKVIPNKNTRILIYCNNNFKGSPPNLVAKCAPLALNIPTFINLYGYGYKNLYELQELVKITDPRLEVVRAKK